MNTVSSNIKITEVSQSKISSVDFENLPFGSVFTDYMVKCDFKNGAWEEPQIMPYQPLTLEPSARVFHYGQAVFEGMKAFKDLNGNAFLFRPLDNWARLNASARRLVMPEIPQDYFMQSMNELLLLDKKWIQSGTGNSLYVRPFIIATEPVISAQYANEYSFMIICSPVRSYYSESIKVLIADKFSRAANGGVGYAKAAGNYAAQFYPTKLAQDNGFKQVIWTDDHEHEFLEEAGTMNIFFRIKDQLITPPTSDRILDGITRKSIIQLAKDEGMDVTIRPLSVSEIKEASQKGELLEIFGTGTAASVSFISAFEHKGVQYSIADENFEWGSKLKENILKIQHNLVEDKHNWRFEIK